MKTDRRKFIECTGLGLTGIILNTNTLDSNALSEFVYNNNLMRLMGSTNPSHIKINVKLIFHTTVHSTA